MLEVESHVYTSAVVRRLRSLKQSSNVYEVTGEYDISAIVNVENVMALNNLIEELRTVTGCQTHRDARGLEKISQHKWQRKSLTCIKRQMETEAQR